MQVPHPLLSSPVPVLANPALPQARRNARAAEDALVKSRLGVYSGLFYALRAKHPPTAAHSLRVAMSCSKWACSRGMPEADRDILEVSALLHDLGKIGVPDNVLQKPSQLEGHEQLMMEMSCSMATEMLRGAGAGDEVIRIVEQARIAFQDLKHQQPSANMMAIVDAFDSMTTEQVFRRAMSRERAIEELCASAGTQFSTEYVREFAELVSRPRPELEAELLNRWIAKFSTDAIPGLYGPGNPCGGLTESSLMSSSGAIQNLVDTVFHRRLLDTLADAAIYLDAGGQILHWNRAAERMSGRGAASLLHRAWSSELMGLADDSGQPLNKERCLLRTVAATHTQSNLRLQVMREDGHHFKVHATVIPVFSKAREFTGAILLIRDASAQANLEERVQTLNAIACSDPLTKVANRAALNQRLVDFVRLHLESGERGSIIMCDIDFFKRINDNHGHQAGDEALVTFANLLRESARDDDFVARYGGEEFVILCDQCDNPSATTLAEEMRRAVESTPVPALDGKTMTCSFGVTEVQDGDSEETLLARADRALLMAKEGGRNRVVQLGAGMDEHAAKSSSDKQLLSEQLKANWLGWFRSEKAMVEREYLASVPEAVAIEKLKGFIADHQAEVLSATESHVSIRIDGQNSEGVRRRGERAAIIMLDVHLQSVQVCANGRSKTYQNRTKFTVSARPVKSRDRRTAFLMGQINQILHSFQAYLVAQAIDSELKANIIEPR